MHGHLCGLTDFELPSLDKGKEFPFRSEISLKPLIDFWTRAADGNTAKGAMARMVAEEVKKAPELLETITSCAALAPHKDLLDPSSCAGSTRRR
jgi:hypothetical protein